MKRFFSVGRDLSTSQSVKKTLHFCGYSFDSKEMSISQTEVKQNLTLPKQFTLTLTNIMLPNVYPKEQICSYLEKIQNCNIVGV